MPAMRAVALLMLAAGCGDVAGAPAPKTAPDLAAAVCERALRCGQIGVSQLAECRTTPRLTLIWGSPELLGIDRLIREGRLRLAPGGEQACIQALTTAGCRDHAALGACGIAYRPTVPAVAAGGACERDDECIAGRCTAAAGCKGTCVADIAIGKACGNEQRCADGSFCESGVCRARAKAGDPCGGHWQWCAEGLFCAGYSPAFRGRPTSKPEVLGTCRAPLGVGERCAGDSDGHCRADLYCAWGDAKPTCQKPLAKGEVCRWLDACADGLACTGLVLGGVAPDHPHFAVATPGRCAPILDAGATCDPAAFVSGCPQTMRCDRTTKRCRSAGHEGDPCQSSWITTPQPTDKPIVNDGCVSAHYCDVATRTCKKALPAGARCTPQTFGVEDEPCFLTQCSAKTKRCVAACTR